MQRERRAANGEAEAAVSPQEAAAAQARGLSTGCRRRASSISGASARALSHPVAGPGAAIGGRGGGDHRGRDAGGEPACCGDGARRHVSCPKASGALASSDSEVGGDIWFLLLL